MFKNCIKYLNEKVIYALISLIINLIFGILLFVWKNDPSKTATINSIDKIIHAILDILLLLKSMFCYKKETNEKIEEPEKEISAIEKGRMLLKANNEKKETIDKLIKFIEDNKDSKDPKIKEEVKEAENILESIKKNEN